MPKILIRRFYIIQRNGYFRLMQIEAFPPLELADEHGLLAMGGDLRPERLLVAYRSGIFPWYNPGEPILWWSPDPRCVILPDQFKPSRSLRKSMRNRGYDFSINQAFEQVIRACAAPRQYESGTWITEQMHDAYVQLHHQGIAHSAEVWSEGKLVGGLYGIGLGRVFFGESMFSHQTDASKVALANLITQLVDWDFELIDCQVSSPHVLSLGAMDIPRTEFMKRLECALSKTTSNANWPRKFL